MSKCMVSFIDWYLLRINASEREKIKVRREPLPAPVECQLLWKLLNIKCTSVIIWIVHQMHKQIEWAVELTVIRVFQSARHGDPHTHTIDNVDLDHEGLYTCVVGNGELITCRHYSFLISQVENFTAIANNVSNSFLNIVFSSCDILTEWQEGCWYGFQCWTKLMI